MATARRDEINELIRIGADETAASAVSRYDNSQEAATLWCHGHTPGITRLNVYAGLAGFYLLRDDHETELMESGGLPAERHEVELVIQDRTFCPDGGLAYPDVPSGPGLPSQKVTWPCSVLSLDLDLGLA
jgi:FtsP/CotA-like multicopper oxidase with cupredoxin domain